MSTIVVRAIVEQEPREVLDWGVDWSEVLEPDELVTGSEWSIPTSLSGLGIVLSNLPTINNITYVRMEVASDAQANAQWDGDGIVVPLTCEMTTSYFREITRTLMIRIKRHAHSPRERVLVA
jgi:hypothetical protein